jgi:hypothetical protein
MYDRTGLLHLLEDGKLRLDDRVRDHMTTTALHARGAGLLDVTIRELLRCPTPAKSAARAGMIGAAGASA